MPTADVRSRCDMILWSNEGLSSPQIAKRVRFSHDTMDALLEAVEQFYQELEDDREQVLRLLGKWAELISS